MICFLCSHKSPNKAPMMRSVIPNPSTMNTAVRFGGSAPPMDSLESLVDVWVWELLRVLSATLVC